MFINKDINYVASCAAGSDSTFADNKAVEAPSGSDKVSDGGAKQTKNQSFSLPSAF